MSDNIKLPPYPEGLCLREDIEDYAREAVRLNAQADAKPMFWVRLCSDDGYEGPIHDSRIEDVRKQSGAWHPLYLAAPAAPQPAQQPTDEHKAIMLECRNQAMRWTLEARIPEAGAFGGIAQDLDYLCGQLGVKND